MDFLSMFQAALGRMDYLIMYAFVQFLRGVIETFFAHSDIIYISAATALVTTAWRHTVAVSAVQHALFIPVSDTLTVVVSALHRAGIILLVDTVMVSLRTVHIDDTDTHQALMYWITATGAVVLIPVLTESMHSVSAFTQLSRLVFFMYAENSEFLTQDTEINRVAPALAIVGLTVVRRWSKDVRSTLLTNLISAAVMLLTNIVINSLVGSATEAATDSEGEIAWVVALLLFSDQLQQMMPDAADVRDYAVWKSAQLLTSSLVYRGYDVLVISSGALCIAAGMHILTNAAAWPGSKFRLRSDAVTQLSILVAVNCVIDLFKTFMMGIPHRLLPLVLLVLLCVTSVVLRR